MANTSKTVKLTTTVFNDLGQISYKSSQITPNVDYRDMLGVHVTSLEPTIWHAFTRQSAGDNRWTFTSQLYRRKRDGTIGYPKKGKQVTVLVTMVGEPK